MSRKSFLKQMCASRLPFKERLGEDREDFLGRRSDGKSRLYFGLFSTSRYLDIHFSQLRSHFTAFLLI
jgi:hypothetical protein